MSLLFYRRPDYVERHSGPMGANDYQTYLEKSRAAIPTELCFEYVVTNRALPVRYNFSDHSSIEKLTLLAMFAS